MKRWLKVVAMAAATAVLALGAAAWIWGAPGWLLTPWLRLWSPAPVAAEDDRTRILGELVAKLNAENVLLRARLEQYRQIQGEGGFPPERVVVARARVVARTARSGRRYVELDCGGGDGVVRDLPVVSGWSLVGTISGVREGRSLVQELTDSESRIAATLLDGHSLLAEGVLVGTGDPGLARLDYVEPRDGLRVLPGMQVVTAGGDGRVPAGLLLGTVTSAQGGSGADHWRISVRPQATTQAVESLLVLRVPDAPAPSAQPSGSQAPAPNP